MSTTDGQPTTDNPTLLPAKSQTLRSCVSQLSQWSSRECYCSRVTDSRATVSIWSVRYWQTVDRLYGVRYRQRVDRLYSVRYWQTVDRPYSVRYRQRVDCTVWGTDREWTDCTVWCTDREWRDCTVLGTDREWTVQYEVLTESGQTVQC